MKILPPSPPPAALPLQEEKTQQQQLNRKCIYFTHIHPQAQVGSILRADAMCPNHPPPHPHQSPPPPASNNKKKYLSHTQRQTDIRRRTHNTRRQKHTKHSTFARSGRYSIPARSQRPAHTRTPCSTFSDHITITLPTFQQTVRDILLSSLLTNSIQTRTVLLWHTIPFMKQW